MLRRPEIVSITDRRCEQDGRERVANHALFLISSKVKTLHRTFDLFLYGEAQPSVICSPLQVCDIELQGGEVVRDVLAGDTVLGGHDCFDRDGHRHGDAS